MPQEEQNQPSTWTQVKGAAKVACSLLLYTQPLAALGVAAAWVAVTAVKRYREDTDHTKSFFQRVKETGAMMVGMEVGTMIPAVGVAIAAVGAMYAAYSGNDVSGASMQGAVIGFAVKSVLLPIVALAVGATGVYNMATGQETDILEKGLGVVRTIQRGLDRLLGKVSNEPTRTKEDRANVGAALKGFGTTAKTVERVVAQVTPEYVQTAAGVIGAGAKNALNAVDTATRPVAPPVKDQRAR